MIERIAKVIGFDFEGVTIDGTFSISRVATFGERTFIRKNLRLIDDSRIKEVAPSEESPLKYNIRLVIGADSDLSSVKGDASDVVLRVLLDNLQDDTLDINDELIRVLKTEAYYYFQVTTDKTYDMKTLNTIIDKYGAKNDMELLDNGFIRVKSYSFERAQNDLSLLLKTTRLHGTGQDRSLEFSEDLSRQIRRPKTNMDKYKDTVYAVQKNIEHHTGYLEGIEKAIDTGKANYSTSISRRRRKTPTVSDIDSLDFPSIFLSKSDESPEDKLDKKLSTILNKTAIAAWFVFRAKRLEARMTLTIPEMQKKFLRNYFEDGNDITKFLRPAYRKKDPVEVFKTFDTLINQKKKELLEDQTLNKDQRTEKNEEYYKQTFNEIFKFDDDKLKDDKSLQMDYPELREAYNLKKTLEENNAKKVLVSIRKAYSGTATSKIAKELNKELKDKYELVSLNKSVELQPEIREVISELISNKLDAYRKQHRNESVDVDKTKQHANEFITTYNVANKHTQNDLNEIANTLENVADGELYNDIIETVSSMDYPNFVISSIDELDKNSKNDKIIAEYEKKAGDAKALIEAYTKTTDAKEKKLIRYKIAKNYTGDTIEHLSDTLPTLQNAIDSYRSREAESPDIGKTRQQLENSYKDFENRFIKLKSSLESYTSLGDKLKFIQEEAKPAYTELLEFQKTVEDSIYTRRGYNELKNKTNTLVAKFKRTFSFADRQSTQIDDYFYTTNNSIQDIVKKTSILKKEIVKFKTIGTIKKSKQDKLLSDITSTVAEVKEVQESIKTKYDAHIKANPAASESIKRKFSELYHECVNIDEYLSNLSELVNDIEVETDNVTKEKTTREDNTATTTVKQENVISDDKL